MAAALQMTQMTQISGRCPIHVHLRHPRHLRIILLIHKTSKNGV
jgi:hypothetical protein